MKFSVSMYSYMQKIRSGEATPFELIAKTKELGFDAIEFVDFTDFGTGTKEERLAHAEELRKECERVGLEISALVMSCDFITGSDGDLDKEIARVKRLRRHRTRPRCHPYAPRRSHRLCTQLR